MNLDLVPLDYEEDLFSNYRLDLFWHFHYWVNKIEYHSGIPYFIYKTKDVWRTL